MVRAGARTAEQKEKTRKIGMQLAVLVLFTLFGLLLLSARGHTVRAGSRLSKTYLSLNCGESAKLSVSGTKKTVRWTVKNKKIASVKRLGRAKASIQGKRGGVTTVTAKVGGKSLRCLVVVSDLSALELETTVEWTSHWKNGTWDEDGYRSEEGDLLVDGKLALSQTELVVKKAAKYPYLYIGASRTQNAADAVKDKSVYFYGCGGAGFRWLFNPTYKNGKRKEAAFSVLRSYLTLRPAGTVIIDLGGNDLSNLEAYVGFYRTLLKLYPNAKIWFMELLPRAKSNASNADRKAFDLRLEKEFPGHVICLYDWVYSQSDFRTTDGTHYPKKFTRKLYQKTMAYIGRRVKVNSRTGKVTRR